MVCLWCKGLILRRQFWRWWKEFVKHQVAYMDIVELLKCWNLWHPRG